MTRLPRSFVFLAAAISLSARADIEIGTARVDITPELPITLFGYPNRTTEAEAVAKPLYARALALGTLGVPPVVAIVAEVTGITAAVSEAVAAALRESHGLDRSRVAVLVTHTHTAPGTTGYLPFGYGRELPADAAARIARYTGELERRLIAVGRTALANRRPGRLEWAEGRLDVAVQRRRIEQGRWVGFGQVPGGPVDPAVPVLRATDANGAVRAWLAAYACHCTTLGGMNVVHPDWAGEAAGRLEAEASGAVALIAIGCGADAGPVPRGSLAAVEEIGARLAAEIRRVSAGRMQSLDGGIAAAWRTIELPLDPPPSREEFHARAAAKKKGPATDSVAARHFVSELDAGRPLPRAMLYPVQTWSFGPDLAMVFLGGEVVADYALRLKRELPAGRVWVNAYANAMPGYIPSRRMYEEGGYEVDVSIVKHGWPARLAAGTEERIVETVHGLLPATFPRNASGAEHGER